MPRISGLYVYPLKSAKGTAVEQLTLDDRGAVSDRRWMVVDDDGVFVSQREEPRLALVAPTLTQSGLSITAPGMRPIEVSRPDSAAETIRGEVWDGDCPVRVAEESANAWFSQFLGRSVRLVFQPDESVLRMLPQYAGTITEPRHIALTDGSPLLLIGQSSLDDLNRRLADALPMNRFRPNIVVRGAEPYEEDSWRRIEAGGISFEIVQPCPRCVTTTVDQSSGVRGEEPLRTLATYRKVGSKVMFGQNATHHAPGTIRLGDEVRIVERV